MSQRIKIKTLLQSEKTGIEVTVKGWIRTFRNNQFIALNDGSTNSNLQVVVDFENTDPALLKRLTNGAAISVLGQLVQSLGKGQTVEVKATSIEVLGDSDPEHYKIQPKKHSLEFLRENAHLRFRTNTFGSIFRLRNSLSFAVHTFFQSKGFVYLHTPIITQSDAEGAGEAFRVTTLDLTASPVRNKRLEKYEDSYLEFVYVTIKEFFTEDYLIEIDRKIKKIEKDYTLERIIRANPNELKYIAQNSGFKALGPIFKIIYNKLKTYVFYKDQDGKRYIKRSIVEELGYVARKRLSFYYKIKDHPELSLSFYNIEFFYLELMKYHDNYIDFKSDFFGKSTNLTVSGQLEGELGAMALSDIYTFGPTFRAENSNTTRHLAEFWMIEPEMAFYDLTDNMNLAEELLKYVIRYVLDKNAEDLEFLSQRLAEEEKQKPQNERSEMSLTDKLTFCLDNNFERLTYTEAIEILRESTPNKKKKFQYPVEGWGTDLQSEHERYLVEKHFKKPVILTDYPKEIKSFYMRQNDDGKTVAAMDILFPGIGEIIGGSQREERLEKLEQRMDEMGIPKDELWWYLDTRRFGACPHAGFGLGFERLVLFVTGMGNIRDVIPFPRYPKNAEF